MTIKHDFPAKVGAVLRAAIEFVDADRKYRNSNYTGTQPTPNDLGSAVDAVRDAAFAHAVDEWAKKTEPTDAD